MTIACPVESTHHQGTLKFICHRSLFIDPCLKLRSESPKKSISSYPMKLSTTAERICKIADSPESLKNYDLQSNMSQPP